MDLRLTDKVAVVTGANRGIGLAITEALVAEGAYVVAGSLSTENLDGLERVIVGEMAVKSEIIRPHPGEVLGLHLTDIAYGRRRVNVRVRFDHLRDRHRYNRTGSPDQ